jgi:ribosomal protein L11 methyltransferase
MYELVLHVAQRVVDGVGDTLMQEWQALSVSVEDADAGTSAERAMFAEPGMPAAQPGWEHSWVRALFDDDTLATRAAAAVLAQDGAQDVRVHAIQHVPDQDWVRLTQSQFDPVRITEQFWIVPSWHEPPAQARHVVRLDPGLAFGTGTHATTQMCLRWLAHQAPELAHGWTRVLDYGCGSGILAIGAALFGASQIDAVDIDEAAVQASRANAQSNGVDLNVGTPERATGRYALVLANILATPLKLLAPLLCAHVAPQGDLVLAGILERQAGELFAAYAPWLRLEVTDTQDGWILMTARRAA